MSKVIINENEDYYIKLAKRYCNLSNRHDLQSIRKMVHKDATIYGHHGVKDIIKGMNTFREQYPNVSWVFHKFHLIGKIFDNNIKQLVTRVSFTFDRYWHNKDDERLKCTATEYIDFTSDGLMMSIGYIEGPSEPIPCGYTIINELKSNDVICGYEGKGQGNEHPGNQLFRRFVSESRSVYQAATKHEKRIILRGIVDKMHNLNPPGRFLIKYESGYIEMEYDRALNKTCTAFHELDKKSKTVSADKVKTELCTHYTTPKGCAFGAKCKFAHGEHELVKD